MNKHNMRIFTAVSMLIITSLACGSSPKVVQGISTKTPSNQQSMPTATKRSTPTSTGQSAPTSTKKSTPIPPGSSQGQTYNAGDVVPADTHTITLNSAQITGDVLQVNFTIVNTGSMSVTINPISSFEAKDSNGMPL